MSFITYNSIPNHTDKKTIDYFFKENPQYSKIDYICQHKYDGSNFSIILTKTDQSEITIEYGSRNCLLEDGQDFNNHLTIMKKDLYRKILDNLSNYLKQSTKITRINLFGEIYGKVQNRIKYHNENENRILFFDIMFDQVYQTPKFFIQLAKELDIPTVEMFMIDSFEKCLQFDLNSVKTEAGDKIEGVVIKPYDMQNNEPFYVKVKMDGFEEITNKKQCEKPKVELDRRQKFTKFYSQYPELSDFENYLNPNRAKSAFSKRPWTKKEQPQLANAILEDALKDFLIDYEQSKLTIDVLKKVFLTDVFKIINEEKYFQ